MTKGKLRPIAFGVGAILIAFFTYLFLSSHVTEVALGKTESTSSKSENAAITNDVENRVNGENANVMNTIDNRIENGNNNTIDNKVTNHIDVKVDIKVTNQINNKVDEQETDSNAIGNNGHQNGAESGHQSGQGNENDELWGVDSASLTTNERLSCVRDTYGSPKVWGRYLGDKEGVSEGLTKDEVQLLHSNGIGILVIWNQFTNGTGYENGLNEARRASEQARHLGIPEDVAIFADIEPNYPVDAAFLKGWNEGLKQTPYQSGIYGIFDQDQQLAKAYEQAVAESPSLSEETFLWTAAPSIGVTTEAEAPNFNPTAPEHGRIGGWQYGIDSPACNIDTNLFSHDVVQAIWK